MKLGGKTVLFGLLGLLALTLFMTGFEEGVSQYLGGVEWYFKIGVGVMIAYFLGKSLL